MYKVIKYFTDLQDNSYAYHEGETFPREGLTVTPERLAELSSDKNKRGIPLIDEVKEEVEINPPEIAKASSKPKRTRKKG